MLNYTFINTFMQKMPYKPLKIEVTSNGKKLKASESIVRSGNDKVKKILESVNNQPYSESLYYTVDDLHKEASNCSIIVKNQNNEEILTISWKIPADYIDMINVFFDGPLNSCVDDVSKMLQNFSKVDSINKTNKNYCEITRYCNQPGDVPTFLVTNKNMFYKKQMYLNLDEIIKEQNYTLEQLSYERYFN